MDRSDSFSSHELVEALAKQFVLSGDCGMSSHDLARLCLSVLARLCLSVLAGKGFEVREVATVTSVDRSDAANAVAEMLGSKAKFRLRDLLNLWRQVSSEDAAGPADLYSKIGERVLKSGEPLLAYDILHAGSRHWPKDLRLHQLLSLRWRAVVHRFRRQGILNSLSTKATRTRRRLVCWPGRAKTYGNLSLI